VRLKTASFSVAVLLVLSGCSATAPTSAPNPTAGRSVPPTTEATAPAAAAARPTSAPPPPTVLEVRPTTATAAASSPAPVPAASPAAAAPTAPPAQANGGSFPGPYFLGSAAAPVVIDEYADYQ
jgi:hypothetical protein